MLAFALRVVALLTSLQEMPSNVYKMQENARRPGLRPGPRWGSLQRSPRPLAGGEQVASLPKNSTWLSAFQASALWALPPNFQTPSSKILVLFIVPPNVLQPLTPLPSLTTFSSGSNCPVCPIERFLAAER